MNHKYNPWVSLVALLLMALILVLNLTGCQAETARAAETEPAPRFTTEYGGNNITIITDNQTGAQYLAYVQYHTGIGLTKLED